MRLLEIAQEALNPARERALRRVLVGPLHHGLLLLCGGAQSRVQCKHQILQDKGVKRVEAGEGVGAARELRQDHARILEVLH